MPTPSLEIPRSAREHASAELQTALQAALAGSEVIREYFDRGVEMRSKGDGVSYNLVSDADVESEQAIAQCIQTQFPSHVILGEEAYAGDVNAEHLWIVDPLDGTNNFAHRIPHFAVSVAYYQQGQAQAGVVVNPIRHDWYWAERGQGAFHNGRRLKVDPARKLADAIIACGFFYDRGAMMEATLAAIHGFFKQDIHGIRRFGTAALDFCQVADGLFGAFFEYQLQPWDVAAGRLIVEEAGGKVTDGRGGPLPLAQSSTLVSNGWLHDACLQIVRQHHPPSAQPE